MGIGLPLALLAAFVAGGLWNIDSASDEGVVCEAICRELIANTTEGRQALVSSAWWPPFPVLLRLPFAVLVRDEAGPVASLLISALFGVAALFLLHRILREWGIGWPRWLMTASLGLNPLFLRECCDGSSGTPVLFLLFLATYGLIQWITQKKLRFLIYLAFGSAFLLATNLEMAPWGLLVLLLFVLDQFLSPSQSHHREAVLILAFFPPLYTVGLWMLMNWLVMGDALYFVRSLFTPASVHDVIPAAPVETAISCYLSAAMAFALLLVAWVRRDRAGLYLGILGFCPMAFALFMEKKGWLWNQVPVLSSLFPLAILSAAYIAVLSRRFARVAAGCAALALLTIAGSMIVKHYARERGARNDGEYARVTTEQNQWMPRIERHVLNRSKYATVFVCGYDGFSLLGARPSPVFIRALDFNFDKAEKDYSGHDLYVLVRQPQGRSAMDSIHWKYERIFTLGSRTTLYDADFGDWRLFEIIQATREEETK
jgi:hypothetical protein